MARSRDLRRDYRSVGRVAVGLGDRTRGPRKLLRARPASPQVGDWLSGSVGRWLGCQSSVCLLLDRFSRAATQSLIACHGRDGRSWIISGLSLFFAAPMQLRKCDWCGKRTYFRKGHCFNRRCVLSSVAVGCSCHGGCVVVGWSVVVQGVTVMT